MARTSTKLAALLAACALAASAAATLADTSPVPDFRDQPVQVEAAGGSEVDFHTKEVILRNVVISQGTMRVSADRARATGLNFANSRWNFQGDVRIDGEQRGNLRADQAIVEFKDNHIARATITGKPAEFEQKRAESAQIARGHADEIVYDVNEGTVRLANEAWLCDGQSQISGPLLVYNIREQRVQAATVPAAGDGTDRRYHISIDPHAPKSESTGCEAPKTGSPSAKPAQPAATTPEPSPKS
ncbi:MAG TPA: LptA/OstA family protein [Steroidobacteraceae bacterium]|jgi:lipopolysaccharide transport protein LptA|nr:LptA/OstA family protein [Steroidobacteraceae bacterium]